jgi:L-lactate utilization protein LutC
VRHKTRSCMRSLQAVKSRPKQLLRSSMLATVAPALLVHTSSLTGQAQWPETAARDHMKDSNAQQHVHCRMPSSRCVKARHATTSQTLACTVVRAHVRTHKDTCGAVAGDAAHGGDAGEAYACTMTSTQDPKITLCWKAGDCKQQLQHKHPNPVRLPLHPQNKPRHFVQSKRKHFHHWPMDACKST